VSMYKFYYNGTSEKLSIGLTAYNISISMLDLRVIFNKNLIQNGGSSSISNNQTCTCILEMKSNTEGWLYFYVKWSILGNDERDTSYFAEYNLLIV
ncbi:MAG: hypothetical protein ACTSVU_04890, partial [Promethearchaeota archaeon]